PTEVGAPLYADFDVVAFDLNVVLRQLRGWIERILTSDHIKLPAMPGAGEDVSFELSFAYRTAAMRTHILECIKIASDIPDGNLIPVQFKNLSCSFRNIRFFSQLHKFRHSNLH